MSAAQPRAWGGNTSARARVLVLGGSGFVGRHVVAELSAAGHLVVVLTRHRTRARHLLLLPTVQVVDGDPHDDATLARHSRGMTAAITLITIAAVVEKNLTTNHATTIKPMHVPIST